MNKIKRSNNLISTKNNIDNKNAMVSRIFRKKDIDLIVSKINMMGDTRLNVGDFLYLRAILSILSFIVVLILFNYNYILAPIVGIAIYYAIYYLLIVHPIKRRISKLDHEALNFFEILELTLQSGRNLENSLEITVNNTDSELSNEFKKTLLEMKFGKSLIEALDGMKKRIPSEAINNILLDMTETSVFGNNIIENMNNQINFLWEKQSLDIKGKINMLPNKVSILSVIFIIPLILLLVLGPFIVNFIGQNH
jgi:Flp pilus assembly protein TadB